MNDQLLNIQNLTVDYRSSNKTVHAVRGLNLQLRPGETLGLVGETGAGKTTTALSILRILPDVAARVLSGEILFDGKDLRTRSKKEMRQIRGRDIAMIFQDPMTSLDPVVTVGAQIEEMIALHSDLPRSGLRKAAEDMLEVVGIKKERFDDYPHQFSGGMKQRVVIAIALSCNPKI
ncbi:MAG: ATP-binding cassette domain-containing protein, partial [Candidatus Aphodomorpha sp.]